MKLTVPNISLTSTDANSHERAGKLHRKKNILEKDKLNKSIKEKMVNFPPGTLITFTIKRTCTIT